MVRRKYQRRVFVRDWKAEHLGNERHRFAKPETRKFQVTLEVRDALLGALVASPTQALVEYLSYGVKRCALRELVSGALHPQMGIVADAAAELIA